MQRKQWLADSTEAVIKDKAVTYCELLQAREVPNQSPFKTDTSRQCVQKLSAEPERLRKQADCIYKASEKLRHELTCVAEEIASADRVLRQHHARRIEGEAVRSNLLHKLELHRSAVLSRQRDVDAVRKNVDIEIARGHQLSETSLALQLQLKEAAEHSRYVADSTSRTRTQYQVVMQQCRKKQVAARATVELVPSFRSRVFDSNDKLKRYYSGKQTRSLAVVSIRDEVDMTIAKLLRYENAEIAERAELEMLLRDVARLETEVASWSAEDRRQTKLIVVINAQRELKARESTRSRQSQKNMNVQLQVVDLMILDLSKEYVECRNRLKEFSALYDVVKNERNKYVTLIQSSSQALAEMKEKVKILTTEVDILRSESTAKDRALSKEHAQHAASETHRNSLRLELFKSQAEYRNKQGLVEQHLIDIDKLNTVISSMEREMLCQKQNFGRAVEIRNYAGASLIDNNDKLCILYEKVNLQNQATKWGELSVRRKNEDNRMLRLTLARMQQQVSMFRTVAARMPHLVDFTTQLQTQLKVEQEASALLCRCLESPSESKRWRQLPCKDGTDQELASHAISLSTQFNTQSSMLLEQALVLEEVSHLTLKLLQKTDLERQNVSVHTQQVNLAKTAVQRVSKALRATVAELSMYQASVVQLHQQRVNASWELQRATRNLRNGDPPNADVGNLSSSRVEQLRTIEGVQRPHTRSGKGSVPWFALKRVTTQCRPTAYVPSNADLGVPRPYSALAPFKPTAPGSTMRHMRTPSQNIVRL